MARRIGANIPRFLKKFLSKLANKSWDINIRFLGKNAKTGKKEWGEKKPAGRSLITMKEITKSEIGLNLPRNLGRRIFIAVAGTAAGDPSLIKTTKSKK
jgi:hypothetical protein